MKLLCTNTINHILVCKDICIYTVRYKIQTYEMVDEYYKFTYI